MTQSELAALFAKRAPRSVAKDLLRFVFGDGANRQTSHTQYGGDETCQLWDHTLELNAAARTTEIALATENRVWVIRADPAGKLACFGVRRSSLHLPGP